MLLADLKTRLGIVGTKDDAVLQQALDAASNWVNERVHAEDESDSSTVSAPPYILTGWNVDTTETSGEPPVGFFRVDDVNEPTVFYLSSTDRFAEDMSSAFGEAVAGDRVAGVQLRNAANYGVVDIGTPVDNTTWWEFPVAVSVANPTTPITTGQVYQFIFRHSGGPALHPEVEEAIALIASRLYRRRLTPEGVAGWADIGAIRIVTRDPDVQSLLEFHIDVTEAVGLA